MRCTVRHNGDPIVATLKSGDPTRTGTFIGVWSSDRVTSDELPGVVFETQVGIRGRADVTIEVASDFVTA